MATVKNVLIVKGSNVIVLAPTTTVLRAAELMAEVNVGSVIVGNDNELWGIFTERDLLQRVVAAGRAPSAVLLSNVMSYPLKCCHPSDDLRKSAEMLTRSRIRHLAVVEDGVMVGQISQRDILETELRSTQERLKVLQSLAQQNSLEPARISKNLGPRTIGLKVQSENQVCI